MAQQTVWSNPNTEPFGDSVPNENPSNLGAFVFPLRFPGQYADVETGLFYNYFRDYSATEGRYTTFDPIGLAGGINGYSYVGSSPLMFTDPTGEAAAGAAAGGFFGGIAGGAAGGAAGSIFGPGGTAVGAVIGRAVGARAGAAAGSAIQDLCTDDKPCDPPEGTMCYEGRDYGKPHAGLSPHFHIFQMQKRRTDNVCQWKYLGGKVGVGVLAQPTPGMSPCSVFPNFIGRGPR